MDEIIDYGEAHTGDGCRQGERGAGGEAAAAQAAGHPTVVLRLHALREGADPPFVADQVELPGGGAGGCAAQEAAHAVVKDHVAVAHQVLVGGGFLVRLHFAEDPFHVAAGEVAHGVDGVAAVVGEIALGVGGDLEDFAQFAVCDHAAGFGKEYIVTAGAVDGDGNVFAGGEVDDFIRLGEAERKGLFGPDRLDAGIDSVNHDLGAQAGRGAEADEVGLFGFQHLPVVGVDSVLVEAPSIGEDLALLCVGVGAGDELGVGGGRIGRRVTVGHKELAPLFDFIVECAAHSSQTDDGGSKGWLGHAGCSWLWRAAGGILTGG